jgi:hypothetical protein
VQFESPAENGSKTTCRLNLLETLLISSRLLIIGFDHVASRPIPGTVYRPQTIVFGAR